MNIARKKELLDLSVDEKLDLIDDLWKSIGSEFPLTPAQSAELTRRLELVEADPKAGKTWSEIHDQ